LTRAGIVRDLRLGDLPGVDEELWMNLGGPMELANTLRCLACVLLLSADSALKPVKAEDIL